MAHATMFRTQRRLAVAAVCVLGLSAAACDLDEILEVQNPGVIYDEDLEDPELVEVVVRGLDYELANFIDENAFAVARMTDEIVGGGSYPETSRLRLGIILDTDTDGHWEQMHEARWMAEIGIERLQRVLGPDFEGSPYTAQAYLVGGIANRALGENFCEVIYDAGPVEPRTVAFERAVAMLQEAIRHGEMAGEEAEEYVLAAYGALAQAFVGLGRWDDAVAAAAHVPTDFVYEADYHTEDNTNTLYSEFYIRYEGSAISTLAGSFDPPDPRAPYTDCSESEDCRAEQGADGVTLVYRQEKYPAIDTDIPMVKGTEMRLIEAEAALLDDDLPTFTSKINEVRTFYGLGTIAQPTSAGALEHPNAGDDAWSILDRERHLTLWLEGRRLWDLHRWNHPFLNGGTLVDRYPGVENRASCYPIPEVEKTRNPNI